MPTPKFQSKDIKHWIVTTQYCTIHVYATDYDRMPNVQGHRFFLGNILIVSLPANLVKMVIEYSEEEDTSEPGND